MSLLRSWDVTEDTAHSWSVPRDTERLLSFVKPVIGIQTLIFVYFRLCPGLSP